MSELNNVDTFLKKIAAGGVCVGCAITLSDPSISEIIAGAGYDFTWIDLEHSPLTLESALNHVIAVRGTQTAPFIRVPWNDPVLIKPVLEFAPAAVIVPMVRTAEEAARAVSACKYPPAGVRGFGPRRGIGFGSMNSRAYLASADRQTLVMIQIEHVDAVKNIEQIVATPGIDGVCIGPNDLSGSMGKLCQHDDPEVCAAITRVLRATRQLGKLAGIAGMSDPKPLEMCLEAGAQWLTPSVDWGNLFAHGCATLKSVRAAHEKRSST